MLHVEYYSKQGLWKRREYHLLINPPLVLRKVPSRICLRKLSGSTSPVNTSLSGFSLEEYSSLGCLIDYLPRRVVIWASVLYYSGTSNTTVSNSPSSTVTSRNAIWIQSPNSIQNRKCEQPMAASTYQEHYDMTIYRLNTRPIYTHDMPGLSETDATPLARRKARRVLQYQQVYSDIQRTLMRPLLIKWA